MYFMSEDQAVEPIDVNDKHETPKTREAEAKLKLFKLESFHGLFFPGHGDCHGSGSSTPSTVVDVTSCNSSFDGGSSFPDRDLGGSSFPDQDLGGLALGGRKLTRRGGGSAPPSTARGETRRQSVTSLLDFSTPDARSASPSNDEPVPSGRKLRQKKSGCRANSLIVTKQEEALWLRYHKPEAIHARVTELKRQYKKEYPTGFASFRKGLLSMEEGEAELCYGIRSL
jgi:hypothetical protein